ncbi:MAG: tRNA pseudouridine(55) synthase TruB [Anaerolineae bacterium]
MTDGEPKVSCAAQTPRTSASGVLVIDKPAGWTSHDVVARVRRITGERRVGHTGTLDPAATGVLVVCVGAATRIVEYLAGLTKRYSATIRFGVETDTWDGEGAVVATSDTDALSLEVLRPLVNTFLGTFPQTPPMYSAIKQNGTPLYRLARRGETVDRAPRLVTIETLVVRQWSPPDLELDVVCGKGTYIRSLAHDLGQASGTGAHLAALRRTAVGHFTLSQASTLDELAEDGAWRRRMLSPAEALRHLPCTVLDAEAVAELRYGRAIPLAADHDAIAVLCALDSSGELVAMLRPDARAAWWRPAKVLVAQD